MTRRRSAVLRPLSIAAVLPELPQPPKAQPVQEILPLPILATGPHDDMPYPTLWADTDWMRDAACGRSDTAELPWISDRPATDPDAIQAMRAVCLACPVFTACGQFVVSTRVSGGFWAGRHRDASQYPSGTELAS
jgi:hypothetical protein